MLFRVVQNSTIMRPRLPSSRITTPSIQEQHISMTTRQLTINVTAHTFVGHTGRRYRMKAVLQDKGSLRGVVYHATDGERDVIIKDIPQDWIARSRIYDTLRLCPHIRRPIDTIKGKRMMVFRYADDHLLNLIQQNPPIKDIKFILKSALEALASMHDLSVSHNDIKPDNIIVHTSKSSTGTVIEEVVLADLEDATILTRSAYLQGAKLGNYMWRSPEAHAGGPMEFPSDIFSFGITVIYALTKMMIFVIQNPKLTEDDKMASIYFRMLSYFAGPGDSQGFLDYLGTAHPEREVFEAVEEACANVPRDPFSNWDVAGLDATSKDLIIKMTKLNPWDRISARQALAHPWFGQ